jgi:cyclophilin family peptidyl-prolyl cis-trans isomerase
MRIPILLSVTALCATSALAQNHAPVVLSIPNLTLRPSTGPIALYLNNYVSDPDLLSLTGTQVRMVVGNSSTQFGYLNLELFDAQTPITVTNFLHYVSTGRYDTVMFHRSVPGFALQAGGYLPWVNGATLRPIQTYPAIQNEPGIANTRGTVAMAKLAGQPDSATSQWYINVVDNPSLDNPLNNGGFTVFGRVIEGGMSFVDNLMSFPNFNYRPELTNLPLANFTPMMPLQFPVDANLLEILNITSGPEMTLSANSDNTGIANPVLTGTTLTVTPNMTGTATLTVTARDFSGVTGTSVSTVSVDPNAPFGNLQNISTRSKVQTGANIMIGGFIITGSGTKRLLIRVVGSELTPFGVPSVLVDPYLLVYNSNSTVIAQNNTWNAQTPTGLVPEGTSADITASGHAPTDIQEPAELVTLGAGAYTVIVQGVGGTTGNALVEVYELDATDTAKLTNISTRGSVGTVNDVMIGGFIIGGTTPKRVVVRGVGPSLGAAGVPSPLANPILQVYAGSQVIAQNDDWASAIGGGVNPDKDAIIASGYAPSSAQESAVILTLAPGPYTAVLRGVNNTTGVGLIEVFDLD